MIAILMSTYNGEKYIREQINSFLNQTNQDWKLFVRDDGSKDSTLSILREFSDKYPDKIFLDESAPRNMGAGESFMYLLNLTDAQYYMFSDQDDVWMDDKIERTLAKVQQLEADFGLDKAIGVFTDLTVVDENLQVVYPSLWKADNRHPEYTRNFYKQWTNRHASYGCTQMFNKAAKKIVLPYIQFEGVMGAHDNWLEYILIREGIYDYVDEPTILYRQHGNNVVGANFGHKYLDDVNELKYHPRILWKKLKKDYKRMKQMPFYVSPLKVFWYRFYQSLSAILKK